MRCAAEMFVRTVCLQSGRIISSPTVLKNLFICTPAAIYFHLSEQPSNTTKTVGGEAVRRFFSLKYAVLSYTVSALFTDPPLRQQKSFRKVFCQAFFQKSVIASPASPRADLIKVAYNVREDNGGVGTGKVIKGGDVTADGIHNTD